MFQMESAINITKNMAYNIMCMADKKLNQIVVKHGEKLKLAELLGHGTPFIRLALLGERDTLDALKIRKVAKERGGIEIIPK